MYLSLRDITFAKGRFALIGGVVALITMLLVLLTGLTSGLSQQNTSALERLDASRVIFSAPAEADDDPSFTESGISASELDDWEEALGGGSVERLGVSQTRAETATGDTQESPSQTATSVAVFSVEADTALAPRLNVIEGQSKPGAGEVILSSVIAEDLGMAQGDTLRLSSSELTVAGVVEDEFYSHVPVVWTSIEDFAGIAHLGEDTVATALAVPASARDLSTEALATVNEQAGTVSTDTRGAFNALPAYQSERGSLLMMQGFLYGISALVVVSFLTVWTIQRTRDLAVLRALGSSRSYLVRDAMTQAAVVVSFGALTGGAAAWAGGLLIGNAVPFELTPLTVAAPVLGVFGLGVAGATLTTRRVSRVDPLFALGGN
ncbi:ABC transporter permease [Nesterenkonia sp. E16_7]|uniref:ABC transporter permease n=1 Tax=unclassified Nesterenkonia TaxID=2629769 RepID=UPI001A90D31E|nr:MULTISPECIES: ABC transporter permease [unclassified Nesterenkonia]MBO0594719.1 ABC transporter permease [Nesterenkonia sp. E16_10]MBO0597468.1 ABC transporter permease [Nesterenkonia sp. E16_7]